MRNLLSAHSKGLAVATPLVFLPGPSKDLATQELGHFWRQSYFKADLPELKRARPLLVA